ncbi:MAG: hypothetical protein C5B60_03680 [Chloroflexi bacterium]|nr:MAG: hypothetical protein C5B60_03680 [Chloroflexota bacterium]
MLELVSARIMNDSYIDLWASRLRAVVGDWEAGRFLLPEIDLCGSPLTLVSGSLDQAEDLAVNCDTLPHQVGGGGALSEERVATFSRSNPARPGREQS